MKTNGVDTVHKPSHVLAPKPESFAMAAALLVPRKHKAVK